MRLFNIEIAVDNFAGGAGASTGIARAMGRPVAVAINHDPAAIAMHKANHPDTEHYCENVWDIDPIKACKGRPVALGWFSPDCKHFSKAKGGKPVSKKIRGLAWIVLKWAAKVKPRVIILENVEEFVTWGPVRKGKPIKSKKGITFEQWKSQLISLGYKVEHKELKACDFGAPTTRNRFFLVARCDGKPIVWPKPTHGNPESAEVKAGLLKPWRTAAEIIDFNIPGKSIFNRKKDLAVNTLRRIAKGIDKFVLNNPKPFITQVNYSGAKWDYCNSIDKPLPTITSHHGFALITPTISQIGQTGGGDRLRDIREPLSTIVSKAEHMLVAPTLIQYHSETVHSEHRGQPTDKPIMTLDGSNRYGLVTSHLTKFYKTGIGQTVEEPLHTVTTSPGHFGNISTFLTSYYGNAGDIGQGVEEPLRTITSRDRFGVVSLSIIKISNSNDMGNWPLVRELLNKYCGYNLADDEVLLLFIAGNYYYISDIKLRMLIPRELFNASGFPEDYIIDIDYHGKKYSQKEQVARCGNAVPPPFAEALTRANLPELCTVTHEELEYLLS